MLTCFSNKHRDVAVLLLALPAGRANAPFLLNPKWPGASSARPLRPQTLLSLAKGAKPSRPKKHLSSWECACCLPAGRRNGLPCTLSPSLEKAHHQPYKGGKVAGALQKGGRNKLAVHGQWNSNQTRSRVQSTKQPCFPSRDCCKLNAPINFTFVIIYYLHISTFHLSPHLFLNCLVFSTNKCFSHYWGWVVDLTCLPVLHRHKAKRQFLP